MSCGSVLGAHRMNTVRSGGSSILLSRALALESLNLSASSKTTMRHGATVGIAAAVRMTSRASATWITTPSVCTQVMSGWLPAAAERH